MGQIYTGDDNISTKPLASKRTDLEHDEQMVAFRYPEFIKFMNGKVTEFFNHQSNAELVQSECAMIHVTGMGHLFNIALLESVKPEFRERVFTDCFIDGYKRFFGKDVTVTVKDDADINQDGVDA